MKKLIALIIISIFIFSLVPLAFAQDTNTDTSAETTESSSGSDDSGNTGTGSRLRTAIRADTREDVRDAREGVLDRRENVRDVSQVDRAACIKKCTVEGSTDCEAKCRALDKGENVLDRRENVRDRSERIRENTRERMRKAANVDVASLGLTEEQMEKIGALSTSEYKKFARDPARLKAYLNAVRVVKVTDAAMLNRRHLSDETIDQLKEAHDAAKERYEAAKEELKTARDKIKEAQKSGDAASALQYSKDYLLNATNSLISHLEQIKAKIQESENIDDARAAELTAKIDVHISDLNALKAEIEAASTKAEIKAAAKKLREKWHRLRHIAKIFAHNVIAGRVQGLINRGIVLEKKLDAVLAKAEEKNITIDVSAEVTQFSDKIAESKEKYEQAQAKITEALDLKATGDAAEGQLKALADEVKELLRQSREAIKDAHNILKDIVKKLKQKDSSADLSEDVEVEVSQETSDSTTDTETA